MTRWTTLALLAAWLLGCDGALLPAARFVADCATAGCPCSADAHCRDGAACTVDRCEAGGCVFSAAADGASCDDGDGCTVGDVCQAGACAATPRDCDDGDACTVGDRCEGGACVAGSARPLYRLTLPLVGDDHPYGVAQAPDAGAYVAGFSIPQPQDFRARVTRMAATGAVVWDKIYPSGISAQLYGAAADGAGGVFVAGVWWVAAQTRTPENWRPLVMRLDANGNELWKQIDAKGGKVEPVVVLPGGDVLALGYEQFQWPSTPIAWRLDGKSGNEVERLRLDGVLGRVYGAVPLADGGVFGCGREGNEGPGSEALLLRYGPGSYSRIGATGTAAIDDALRACAPLGNAGMLGVGAASGAGLTTPLRVRWAGSGALVAGAVQAPLKGSAAWLEGLAALPGGGFVGGGAAVVNGVDLGWWLVGLDAAGERTWSQLGPSGQAGGTDVLRDCAAMVDGAVVCVGEQSEAGVASAHDVVIVRVDAEGRTACK